MKPFDWLARKTCFTFATALVSVLGGQVASLYGYFYFHGHFLREENLPALRSFGPALLVAFILLLPLVSLTHYFLFGLLRAFGLPWEWRRLRIMNDNIHGLEVERSLSRETSLSLLDALSRFPLWNTVTAAVLGLVLFVGLLGVLFFHTRNLEHLFEGIQAGLIALLLYLYVSYVLTDFLSNSARSQTKKIIHEIGAKFEEVHQFSLKGKFASFVAFLFMTLVVLNSLRPTPQGESPIHIFAALFTAFSIGICTMLAALYFASIFRSIEEARAAAEDLASGKTGYLFSGSLDKEFVFLNRSLMAAAKEVNRHRMNLEALVREKTEALENSLKKLDKREKRFRSMIENSSDVISLLGRDGKYFYHSTSIQRILGYSPEEGAAWNALDLIHPEDLHKTFNLLQTVTQSPGLLVEGLSRCRHKDGSWRFLETRALNLLDDPAVTGIVMNTRDITERHLVEESLRESEEKFRRISDSAQDAIILMDAEGKVSFWNRAAEKIFGYTTEEAMGKDLHLLLAPKRFHEACFRGFKKFRRISDSAQDAILMMDAEGRVSFWNRAAEKIFGYTTEEATGTDLHLLLAPKRFHEACFRSFKEFRLSGQGNAVGKTLELAALRKDGEEISVEMSLSAVKIEGAWNAIAVMRNISERKLMELALETAKDGAEAASRAKSEFLANMSHEIRTPLNGVIGMAGLLLDTELSPEQREYAEAASSSADSLLCIINDILDFSKIEAGRVEIETVDFDLRSTVEETADMVAIKAQEKGVEFQYLIHPTVPTALCGDPGRLRQILLNLAGNAIKFTEKGEVFIDVSREQETFSRVTLRFSVTDTGIGIPKDRMDRLFKSFSQVDASTTRRYGGTGLGLAISVRLAEMMGGRVGVETQEGRGSTFWFTAVFEKQPQARQREEEPLEGIRGLRVLVVDDNATNRLVLREQLRSWGCIVDECEQGAAALTKLQQARAEGNPFRIALLDMQMPEMDGETLARKIKVDPALGETILILFTSIGKLRTAAQLHEIGFAACLTKPLKKSQLYNCLVSVLGARITEKSKPRGSAQARMTPQEAAKRRRARILVAEDNPVNQKVALRMLQKLGYAADAVANGKEAVKSLEMIPYDLVFMDVQMPEMNGFEATATIRDPNSRVLNHSVPVVAMTAHAMKGDQERCLEAGMDDYIPKPVNSSALQRALEKYLGSNGPSEALPEPEKDSQRVPVEIGQIQETADGDKAFERELIELFLSDNQVRLQAIESALEARDAEGARQQAHTIKGASASAGARGMQKIAGLLEDVGSREELLLAARILEELKSEFEQVRNYFLNYLNPPESPAA